MEKKLLLIGLSSDLMLSIKIKERFGCLGRAVIPVAENQVVSVMSTSHNEATICGDTIREIICPKSKLEILSYHGNIEEIFNWPDWKNTLDDEIKNCDLLIVVSKDNIIHRPNEILAGISEYLPNRYRLSDYNFKRFQFPEFLKW